MKTLSIYIHVPFCISKCSYCDFLSFGHKDSYIDKYVDALINEIISYSKIVQDYNIKTIFIGGGTPSILSNNHIVKITNALNNNYNIDTNTEFTIESNPGTLDEDKIKTYLSSGINRISLGAQTCNNELLKKLGRIHTYEDLVENYNLIRKVGFNNINIDLMSALPNQSLDLIKEDINKIIKLNPEHISVYSLIIEEGTKFYKLYNNNQLQLPNEETERQMYWMIHDILECNGYKHYEISNYSKQNKECSHNITYWKNKEYIGIGLGASSYFKNIRYKNITKLEEYIKINGDINKLIIEKDIIDNYKSIEEYMFLGLRLLDGINKHDFYIRYNNTIDYYYKDVILKLKKDQLIIEDNNIIKLTSKGLDVSNYVFTKFLIDRN